MRYVCNKKQKIEKLDEVISSINQLRFGLTLGIQTRISSKALAIAKKIKVGNVYINRDIIGANVGMQAFGGCHFSGTGFKAGGPNYLLKFMNEKLISINTTAIGGNSDLLSQ